MACTFVSRGIIFERNKWVFRKCHRENIMGVHKVFLRTLSAVVVFFLSVTCGVAGDLKLFTTDGCSSFPDGTVTQQTLWLQCCIKHDLAYWKGGTVEERLNADKALEHCVAEIGEPAVAQLMLAGVRVGGSPYFPTPFRWGYGWPYPRGYHALSAQEKQQVHNQLKTLEVMIESLKTEIHSSD